MADDYQDIGSGIELFPYTPNWQSRPGSTLSIARDVRKYSGTAVEIDQLTTKTPFVSDATFLLDGHERIYEIVDFFVSRLARVGRFWYRHPTAGFTLKEFAGVGGSNLVCYPNLANLLFEGHERIYLRYNASGDYMSRKVNNVSYDDVDDDISLTLNTILDRDTDPGDVQEFGRLLLCRLDIDTLTINFEADGIGVVKLRFYELVEEYTEI